MKRMLLDRLFYSFSAESGKPCEGRHMVGRENFEDLKWLFENAYDCGLRGAPGFPKDADIELLAFAEASGVPVESVMGNELLPELIALLNHAYVMGRECVQMGAGDAV